MQVHPDVGIRAHRDRLQVSQGQLTVPRPLHAAGNLIRSRGGGIWKSASLDHASPIKPPTATLPIVLLLPVFTTGAQTSQESSVSADNCCGVPSGRLSLGGDTANGSSRVGYSRLSRSIVVTIAANRVTCCMVGRGCCRTIVPDMVTMRWV